MSNLILFLKKNKKVKGNTFYAATRSLPDENGDPLKWEIKPISTRETEELRAECTKEIPIPGKPGAYRPRVDTDLFSAKMVAASVVFPDLYNKELQDSYGVRTPEDLLKEMVDNPAEYDEFIRFVMNFSGVDESMDEKVDEAKNS